MNDNSQWAMPQGFLASYPCYCLKIIAVILREQCSIRGGRAGVHVAGGVPVSCGFKGRITKQKARVESHVSFGKKLGQKSALLVNTHTHTLKSPGLLAPAADTERFSCEPGSLQHREWDTFRA